MNLAAKPFNPNVYNSKFDAAFKPLIYSGGLGKK